MVSGIDITKYSKNVIEGMIAAQLDIQLIEYHKLMSQLLVQTGNAAKAMEHIESLKDLIFMTDTEKVSIDDNTKKLLEDMDKWIIRIDPKSIPMPQNKLVLRPEYRKKKKRGN